MKTVSYVAAAAFLAVANLACNPDCDSLQGVQLSTTVNPNGYEILITANPVSALKGRKISFGNVPAATTFHENFGLVVEVPDGVSGKVELKIEDPDCLDVFNYDFNVVNTDYFTQNIDFVPPTPPDIIIPTVPIAFPTFVDNAWLSPDNPGYCLWFIMRKENGVETALINSDSSFEQATCGCLRDFSTSNLPFAQNHISGVIDKANNFINIFIDRTPIGGDIEEFTGMFIDLEKTPYANNFGLLNCPAPCLVQGAGLSSTGYMMLLTSLKTGRQVVAYQLVL